MDAPAHESTLTRLHMLARTPGVTFAHPSRDAMVVTADSPVSRLRVLGRVHSAAALLRVVIAITDLTATSFQVTLG